MGFSIEKISVYWNGTLAWYPEFSINFDMVEEYSSMLNDVKGKKH